MHIPKPVLVILSATLLMMLLALPFCISSGTVIEGARQSYENALPHGEDEDLWEPSAAQKRWKPLALIASAAMSDILPVNDISALPIDSSPGRTPVKENFTDSGYRDDTIIVEMEQKRMFDSDIFVAHVKIATASQLRTAYAGNKINSTRTNHTSRLSSNFNGIVAINGDYYPNTKAGFIVRQGEVYREKTSKNMDLLLIDEWGDFHILLRGHDEQEAGVKALRKENEIVNGFFFGPALVIDSQVQEIPDNYQFDPRGANPRAAIGQTGPLTYVLVVVNGRSNGSKGVSMTELAQIMGELDCRQAYNLDGGNSATLAFHGQVYNDKPQAERAVTDIIYFASATEQGQ